MSRPRIIAVTGAAALAAGVLVSGPSAYATSSATSGAGGASTTGSSTGYAVLAKEGASAAALASQLRAAGATVSSVNEAIGLVTVSKADSGFLAKARSNGVVANAAANGVIGRAPKGSVSGDEVAAARAAVTKAAAGPAADPLDAQLWDMTMMDVPKAHAVTLGDARVKVGIIDTGVDGSHPDIAPNFDAALSRNFTVDDPALGDLCNYANCVDPANVDDNEHGTHVAGTIGAALNGRGMSGVAPSVSLVNVRAGQDSGYFLLGPVANAITYAADSGIDVVNMSFYIDPWLYNCKGGAPEDTPEQAAEQDLIIATMDRAFKYATQKKVTLVAALGNDHDNIDNPRMDVSSPDYGPAPHDRTITPGQCFDLPVQGKNVIGVSSVGPSGRKADYSNWTSTLNSKSLEVAAPGGWFRDGFGTPTYRTNGNLILSAAPLNVLLANGSVDAAGNVHNSAVVKDCSGGSCAYYQYLQGTSMASPHAAGVAALIVSKFGEKKGNSIFMAPNDVRSILMETAVPQPCPAGGMISYANVGRPPAFDAACVGTQEFNGLYGAGIVNAYNAVRH